MNLLRAWNRFWFQPTSARPFGAFRVVIGVLVLCHLGFVSVDMDHWLTDQGILQGDEARLLAGPLRPSPLQWVQDPSSVHAFMAVTAAVALGFTLGWHTRVMGVMLYVMLLSIHHRNILTNCGPDNLLLLMVFYCMVGPSGSACSLDARRAARRRGTIAEPLILPWAQRLVQLHLCLIYLDTAILKCAGTTWLGGTALHYVLHNPEVGRFDLSVLARSPILVNVLTHVALVGEFALAFLLWFRPTRRWVATFGLMLHGGILFLVNVPLFGELMTACYLTFLDPDELDAFLGMLDPRRWWSRRAAENAVAVLPSNFRLDPPEATRNGSSVVADAVLAHHER